MLFACFIPPIRTLRMRDKTTEMSSPMTAEIHLTVPAATATYPTTSSRLLPLRTEAGIPGQEGLRTPLVAPTVRLTPGVGWGGGSEKSTRVAWLEAHVCKSQQLPDSARLFRGCDVVEPAVLSIDCYFEHPADGTAVSLGDAAFPTTLPFSGLR